MGKQLDSIRLYSSFRRRTSISRSPLDKRAPAWLTHHSLAFITAARLLNAGFVRWASLAHLADAELDAGPAGTERLATMSFCT